MKLAVATICSHVLTPEGWWSYEPFVLEMNQWLHLFDEVIFIAPIEDGPPPEFWAPYQIPAKVRVLPYRRNKGRGLSQEKTGVLEIFPMTLALVRAVRMAGALHVRSPGGIGMVGSLLGPLLTRYRSAKYAGQWTPYDSEPQSFRLQRGILRSKWWGAPVTVYGEWPDQPPHVVPFFTSVLEASQVEGARQAAERPEAFETLRVLFVGRLSRQKNVGVLLRAVHQAHEQGLPVELEVIGSGPEEDELKRTAGRLGINSIVTFPGGLPFERVLDRYTRANVLVLASESEGWPKAIAEAMAFGLVCIGSNRGLVPQMLGEGRGLLVEPGSTDAIVSAFRWVLEHREEADEMRKHGARWGQRYSLDDLREGLRRLHKKWWGVNL